MKKNELFKIIKDDISLLEEGLKDERKAGTAKLELENMIGLAYVKKIIDKALAHYKLNKLCIDKGIAREKASLHMVFTGTFVEAGRADLVGDHVGATAPLVKRKFKEAQGGILFIDEAYSLVNPDMPNDFGTEAVDALVKLMEDNRDDLVIIVAGYTDEMENFLKSNTGLISRFNKFINFPDYTKEELVSILAVMAEKAGRKIDDAAKQKSS